VFVHQGAAATEVPGTATSKAMDTAPIVVFVIPTVLVVVVTHRTRAWQSEILRPMVLLSYALMHRRGKTTAAVSLRPILDAVSRSWMSTIVLKL
jgi:hypothetical protein